MKKISMIRLLLFFMVGLLLFIYLFYTLGYQTDSEVTGDVVDSQDNEENPEEVSEGYLETLKSLGYIN